MPDGKLLVIEDASASASDAAQPNVLVEDPGVRLSLATRIGVVGARTIIVGGNILPMRSGRTMKTYADENTEVFFTVEGCSNIVSARVSFSGKLLDINNND